MSRLGSGGALPSLLNDMPVEGGKNNFCASLGSSEVTNPGQDGLALTERQVTRLMEDDMVSAMQYLQNKGLCLMPISLATRDKGPNAGSTTNNSGKAPATAGAGLSSKEDASEGEV